MPYPVRAATPPVSVLLHSRILKARARTPAQQDTLFQLVRNRHSPKDRDRLKGVAPLRHSHSSCATNQRRGSRRSTPEPGSVRIPGRLVPRRNVDREPLTLNDDIASDFPTRAEGLLRLAIELAFDAPGIAERQDKLILAFPSALFSRPEQGLLRTSSIDLDDNPAQLCCLKIQNQLPVRCGSSPFKQHASQRPIASQRRRGRSDRRRHRRNRESWSWRWLHIALHAHLG